MTQTAQQSAIEGHQKRMDESIRDLRYAQAAPALFKPEWTERAVADIKGARLAIAAVLHG